MTMLSMKERAEAARKVLTVPNAYRSWSRWCNQNNGGGFQIAQIANIRDGLSDMEILSFLAEVLARATMEVAIGLTFDEQDSLSDHQVMIHIYEMFGSGWLAKVRLAVGGDGPLRMLRPDLFRKMGNHDFANELENAVAAAVAEEKAP